MESHTPETSRSGNRLAWTVAVASAAAVAVAAATFWSTVLWPPGESAQERLHSALLASDHTEDDAARGYRFLRSRAGEEISAMEGKIGDVVVEVQGPDQFNGVRYEVFRDEGAARSRFDRRVDDAKRYSPRTGATIFEPTGIPLPAICVEDRSIGTECVMLAKDVVVQASAANDPPLGALGIRGHAVVLLEMALAHLETVRDQV